MGTGPLAPRALPPLPRVVILDYYDSYTNNILTLFTHLYPDQEVLRKVVVIKADRYTWDEFRSTVLPSIDCVILSPGPGRPDNPSDIGFGLDLLRAHPIPILGICLGHQAIGVAFGAKIINTPRITHGHVIPISPVSPAKGLFSSPEWAESGDGEFDVVVYNSLTVDPNSLPDELEVTAWSALLPSGEKRTIQGLAHREYPIWGVQYHPESISSTRGPALLQSFLTRVSTHHSQPPSYPGLPENIIASCSYRVNPTSSSSSKFRARPGRETPMISNSPYPTPPISPSGSSASLFQAGPHGLHPELVEGGSGLRLKLVERLFGDIGRKERTADVFQAVSRRKDKGKDRDMGIGEVWLDGETPTRPTTTSIVTPSFLLTYSLARRRVTLHRSNSPPTHLELEDDSFWDWFGAGQKALTEALSTAGESETVAAVGAGGSSGWKGGWVGWFGYEMKSESLAGYARLPKRDADQGEDDEVDAAWAWCDRVLERRSDGEWVTRGVIADDTSGVSLDSHSPPNHSEIGTPSLISWLSSSGIQIGTFPSGFDTWSDEISSILGDTPPPIVQPIPALPYFTPVSNGADYQDRIGVCREAIRQGESYELTLTTRFTSTFSDPSTISTTPNPSSSSPSSTIPSVSTPTDPLSLYLHLRRSNPAYYSAFLSFPHLTKPITIISSSPERFLKIERGVVEMMPIKGTKARVKPGVCVCAGECPGGEECAERAREEDRKRGEELRLDPKERAENLMIVDLIRSDLLSSCPPSSVLVPKLIALESYGVHNLVTTVRGQLAPNVGVVEAVKRCFPPGSMTGAPKLRSVKLLEGIEECGGKRGVYSGCLGYFSIDGSTDLSVVIRTMVLEGDELSLGAGGAITWLSDPEKEWEEVLTKVRSVVGNLTGV